MNVTEAWSEHETTPSRHHAVSWDGHTDSGELVASGVYFFLLLTEKVIFSKKMVLLV